MGRKSKGYELAAFGLALVLLGVVELLGHRSTSTLIDTARQIRQAHQTIEELDGLLLAQLEVETARRGYSLTGDETLVAPMRDAATRVSEHIEAIRRFTSDDPEQQQRLAALEPHVAAKLVLVEAAIAQRRTHGFDPEREAAQTKAGQERMTAVREGIAELTRIERQVLEERARRTEQRVTEARIVQLGGTFVSVLLLAIVFSRLQRESVRRRASEEQARRNEEDLATTLHSIGDGVIATDAQGRVRRMNAVAEALTGFTIADARDRALREIYHLVDENTGDDEEDPFDRARRETAAGVDRVGVLVRKDGRRLDVAYTSAPILSARKPADAAPDQDGGTGVVLVFRDVTNRLDAARTLRRTHAFLDSIVDNIPHMVFVKDARDLAFVRFNKAGEALLGIKQELLLGKTDRAFFSPEQAQAYIDKDRETLRIGSVLTIPEEPLETPHGVRWLCTKKVPILDHRGEPEYLLGISEDITERRRADAELRRQKAATEAAHRELEAFSYSVAHDLRAPLRSVQGFSEALYDDHAQALGPEGLDHVSRVRNSARRMGELIDDLLVLARMTRADLRRADMDMTALAYDVADQLTKAAERTPSVVVQDGMRVSADSRLVRVLLENLLANSMKFSSRRERPRIEIGMRRENGSNVFFVRDNGSGFDARAAKKLFTAFQRYHPSSEYEGTGIGLATAARIVQRHGGRIWAESRPEHGATFFFVLERADEASSSSPSLPP